MLIPHTSILPFEPHGIPILMLSLDLFALEKRQDKIFKTLVDSGATHDGICETLAHNAYRYGARDIMCTHYQNNGAPHTIRHVYMLRYALRGCRHTTRQIQIAAK